MKTIKCLSMLLMMVALSVGFASCGGDDDEPGNEVDDFFIEYVATGGNLPALTLSDVSMGMAEDFGDRIYGVETQDAIYRFKKQVEGIRDYYSNGGNVIGGAAISGTLTINLTLKNSGGKMIKKGYVYITKDGAEYKV